jgi:hypothetical protein
MRITFICGSLEPGRDGVGDYVRRLAIELLRQGHQVSSIALNDTHINQEDVTTLHIENHKLLLCRVPSKWNLSKRLAKAQKWINDFNPEWLSLQFVPFAFHPRGLPFNLGKYLVQLTKGKLWHIMFHELWVGMNYEAPLKHKYWGKVQRLIIKGVINDIKPTIIHTQTPIYQFELGRLGFKSALLPLFSNIPNLSKPKQYQSTTIQPVRLYNGTCIRMVLFGGIHPGAPVHKLAHDIAQYCSHNAVTATLTMVGRCGSEQEHWASIWKAFGLYVEQLGEQAPEYISELLLNSSIGIATTPAYLIGKSGTVAAMHNHGLPVICISAPWTPTSKLDLKTPLGILVYQEGQIDTIMAATIQLPCTNSASVIAKNLVGSLMNKV